MTEGWRKSSYSGSEAQCVEVGHVARVPLVVVRDTQNRAGAVLAVAPDAWRTFTSGLK
jgi:hypothetical protein